MDCVQNNFLVSEVNTEQKLCCHDLYFYISPFSHPCITCYHKTAGNPRAGLKKQNFIQKLMCLSHCLVFGSVHSVIEIHLVITSRNLTKLYEKNERPVQNMIEQDCAQHSCPCSHRESLQNLTS